MDGEFLIMFAESTHAGMLFFVLNRKTLKGWVHSNLEKGACLFQAVVSVDDSAKAALRHAHSHWKAYNDNVKEVEPW